MQGRNLKENSLDFVGYINFDCIGTIQFPDNTTTKIHYYEEKYQIVLGEKETGETWYKGKNLQSLFYSNQGSKI